MKFAHASQMEWLGGQEEHRGGGLAAKPLLMGEEGSLDNYRLLVGRTTGGGHESPRHRHNFDQVRMALKGRLSIAPRPEGGTLAVVDLPVRYEPQSR